LITLLKSVPLQTLNRSTSPNALPSTLLTDLRYFSLRPPIREPLVETYISTLPLPPDSSHISPEEQEGASQETRERERRERALAERQKQVQEEKRRQRGALQFSKGVLREGEAEIERALLVGKKGLKGYMEVDA
jgi:hypothetical protein